MKFKLKIILTLLLWIGLPLVLFAYLRISSTTPSIGKPAALFVVYSTFSWSIALMAFVMESTRQQLFQQQKALHTALRLGVYGGFALALALVTSPWLTETSQQEILQISGLGFVYCIVAGLLYWVAVIKPDKHID